MLRRPAIRLRPRLLPRALRRSGGCAFGVSRLRFLLGDSGCGVMTVARVHGVRPHGRPRDRVGVRVRERRFNHAEQPEQAVLVVSVWHNPERARAILGERGNPGRAKAILGERASRPLIMKTNLSLLRGRDARSPKVPVSTVHCKSSQSP